MKLIPTFLCNRIAHRPNLAKILENIGWLFFDKIMRMGVGLMIGVWVARYLGPEQFGLLNFATAFTGLFGAIAALGLPGIVVRDIVQDPKGARLTLGTVAVMHILSGTVAYLLILEVIAYLRPEDSLSRVVVAIIGAVMLFKSSDIASYWFESQVLSKYTVWVQNSVFVVFAALRCGLIIMMAPLVVFAWAMLAEAIIAGLILLVVMGKNGPPITTLRINSKRAKKLFSNSWPLMLSGITIWIYMKIDQIMLGQMLGNEAVGIYSAATRISEVWYFIPSTIVASVFPTVVATKKHSENSYQTQLQNLYCLMTILSLSVAIPMTFLAKLLILVMYGEAYIEAGEILSIHIWTSIFVFLGVASSSWFIAEGKQMLSLQRTTVGGLVNIALNLVLIPKFGAIGAAYATVISQAVASLLYDALQKATRDMFWMKMRSINPIIWANLFSKKSYGHHY